MIISKNEFYLYKTKYLNKSLYAAFLKILGFGKSITYVNTFNKILGFNILSNCKIKVNNFNSYQNKALIFFLTIMLQNKIGKIFNVKWRYYLENKYVKGCYRYIRFNQYLPLNGQRTHTNAKTSKRFKKTFNK